jgi:REDY-like protein HapK
MTTIFVLFNLKPGVSVSDYENWARNTDLPTVNRLKSVDEFQVFRCQGLFGSQAPAPYQYIETLRINDMDGLRSDIGTPLMQQVVSEFAGFADNPIFITSQTLEP